MIIVSRGLPVMTATTDSAPGLRRFGIGDALVLLVALSISLERFRAIHWFASFPRTVMWCGRAVLQLAGLSPWAAFGQTRQGLRYSLFVTIVDQLLLRTLCPLLLGLMVAQPLLRLRRPRPPLARVVRQSGLVTCLMGIALVCMLMTLGDMWFSGFALNLGLTRAIILFMIWPLLGLPPWHAERSWIDRLGRGVGWGWIVAIISGALLESLGWS
jgi:hypothetical protein